MWNGIIYPLPHFNAFMSPFMSFFVYLDFYSFRAGCCCYCCCCCCCCCCCLYVWRVWGGSLFCVPPPVVSPKFVDTIWSSLYHFFLPNECVSYVYIHSTFVGVIRSHHLFMPYVSVTKATIDSDRRISTSAAVLHSEINFNEIIYWIWTRI